MSQVWKSESTETYGYTTKSKGSRVGSRRVVSWSARINDRVVEGFSTKRAALAAVARNA